MAKKLYVGNLQFDTTEAQIRELFSQVGQIESIALITDRETGRMKGFGFVEMSSDEGVAEAIKRFNGYSLNDRALTVNEARPREERSGGGFGGGGFNDGHSGGSQRNGKSGFGSSRSRF